MPSGSTRRWTGLNRWYFIVTHRSDQTCSQSPRRFLHAPQTSGRSWWSQVGEMAVMGLTIYTASCILSA